jgi:hypothetical protein
MQLDDKKGFGIYRFFFFRLSHKRTEKSSQLQRGNVTVKHGS